MAIAIANCAIDGNFSIGFEYKPNRRFDSEMQSKFWELGDIYLAMRYPYIVFSTNSNGNQWLVELDGIGTLGYPYYKKQNTWKKITAVYDYTGSKQRIYCDGYLISQRTVTLDYINEVRNLTIRTGAPYEKFYGQIRNVTYTPSAVVLPTLTHPTPQYRPNDYPKNYVPGSQNYTLVNTALNQLKSYPDPQFAGTTDWTASSTNLRYVAGSSGSLTAADVTNAVNIQTELSTKYRYTINVADLQEYYNAVNVQDVAYNNAMINLAKANSSWTAQITSSLIQTDNISPYTVIDPPAVQWTTPLSAFNDTREIYEIEATTLAAQLAGRNIERHIENDEVLNRNLNSGTQTQISQKFADRWTRMLEDLRAVFPGIQSTIYDLHDTTFWSSNSGGQPNNLIADPGFDAANTGMGSISCYPERPNLWNTYQSGNLRGLAFYQRSKYYELAAGYPLNTPFVKLGSHTKEEINIRPSQGLAFYKLLKVMGAKYFWAAYFTIAQTGVQNPKGYVWQLAAPCYVEAVFSNPLYRNIILNGTLMTGNVYRDWYVHYNNPAADIPLYNFKTGDKSIHCVIRRLGTKYLIALGYMPLNNYDDPSMGSTADAVITFSGNTFTLQARRQGSVYYWDSSLGGNPTQIDTWHEDAHFDRWTQTLPPDTIEPQVITVAGSLDRTLLCSDTAGITAANALYPTAIDNMDPNPTLILDSNTVTNGGVCPYVRTKTWHFEDNAGNVSLPFTQTITVQLDPIVDTDPPLFITPPNSLDRVVNCGDITGINAALALYPTAVDVVDPAPVLSTPTVVTTNLGICPYTITRTWTSTDASGNVSAVYTQVITVTATILIPPMAERINIQKQIELSSTEGSLPVTDSNNEQYYLPPGSENDVLSIIGGVPTWSAVPLIGIPFSGTLYYLAKFTPDGQHIGDSRWYDDGQNASFNGAVTTDTLITYRNFLTASGNNEAYQAKYYNKDGNMIAYIKDNGDYYFSNGLSSTSERSLTYLADSQTLTLKGSILGTAFIVNSSGNTYYFQMGTYGTQNEIVSNNGLTNVMPSVHIGAANGGIYTAMAITDQYTLIKPTNTRISYSGTATTDWANSPWLTDSTLNVLGGIHMVSSVSHTDAVTPGDQNSPALKFKTSIYDGGLINAGYVTGKSYSIRHTTASNRLEITNDVGSGTNYFTTTGDLYTSGGLLKPVYKHTGVACNTTAAATLAVVESGVLAGLMTSTSAAAVTITLPSAAVLLAAVGATTGSWYDFAIDNTAGANNVTLAVDAGATIAVITPAITGGNNLVVSVANGIGTFRLYWDSATTAKLMRLA